MQILNKLFIVWGELGARGEEGGVEQGKATSPLPLTWVLCPPF